MVRAPEGGRRGSTEVEGAWHAGGSGHWLVMFEPRLLGGEG